jgi:hypothetical protein
MRHASLIVHTLPAQVESSTDLPGFAFLVNSKEVLSSNRPRRRAGTSRRYHRLVLPFSARTRTANLTRMAEDRFDVLVIARQPKAWPSASSRTGAARKPGRVRAKPLA